MPMIQEGHKKIHPERVKGAHWWTMGLLCLLAVYVISGIVIVPFHGDEATFTWLSGDYERVILQGRVKDVIFEPGTQAKNGQSTRLTTGAVFPFSVGLARNIFNVSFDSLNDRWAWSYAPDGGDQMWAENIKEGNLPHKSLLLLARFISASAGALSLMFFFLSAQRLLSSMPAVWVAVVLLATHGDLLVNIRRAMQEGVKFLFLSIVLYIASVMLTENARRRRMYAWLGLASGLSLAAKQDVAPSLIAIYIVLALIPLWKRNPRDVIIANFLYLSASACIALAVFYALMPVFWLWLLHVPLLAGIAFLLLQLPSLTDKKLAYAGVVILSAVSIWMGGHQPLNAMLQARKSMLGGQVNYRVTNDLFYLDTFENKLQFTLSSIFRSNVMYMESPRFDIDPINAQIAIYEASPVHGRIGSPVDGLVILFFVAGIWALGRRFDLQSILLFSLFIIPMLILLITVPLAFQRYFLILQVPYSLIAGAGAGQIWEWLNKLKARNLPLEGEAGSS